MYRAWILLQPRWVVAGTVLACAGIAGLLGPIAIEVPGEVPMTAQTLLILLPSLLFGWEVGVSASVLYLIAGGMGVPVFAHFTSGWARFSGTTGGFLLAFPVAALLAGWWAPTGTRFRFMRSGALLFLGQITVLAMGMAWQRNIVPSDYSVRESLEPLVPGLVLKTAAGTLLLTAIARVVDRSTRT
jgi:biotin transport system substrate-specific component